MLDNKVIEENLINKKITLPTPAAPVANYLPYSISGNNLYISGQLPMQDGNLIKGKLGDDLGSEDGVKAAELCAINILAQAKMALGGDFSKIKKLVKLGAFVACTPDFHDHPVIVNGASDLMVDILGDAGKHARFAVGVSSLPLNVAVEIDAIFEIE